MSEKLELTIVIKGKAKTGKTRAAMLIEQILGEYGIEVEVDEEEKGDRALAMKKYTQLSSEDFKVAVAHALRKSRVKIFTERLVPR